MTWVVVAVGLGVAGGAASAIQANQNRQKQKGVIGSAFDIAQSQQAIAQKNTREDTNESLVARGLTGGGGVYDRGAAPTTTPGQGGATAVGGQVDQSLAVQQSLERQGLENEKAGTYADINAAANNTEVAGIAGGLSSAVGAAANAPGKTTTTPSPIAAAYGSPVAGAVGDPGSSPYKGAFGIDPVNPLGRGAWSAPDTTGGFNVEKNG